MALVVEGIVGVGTLLLAGWTLRLLIAISWQVIVAREWHTRGLGGKDVLVVSCILTGLAWAGSFGLVAGGSWLLARFAPGVWAWVAGSWGVKAGVAGSVLWQAIPFFGETGRELGESIRAGYFETHRDELPKRLTPRQEAYVRHYRQTAERLATEQAADASGTPVGGEPADGRVGFAIEGAASRQALRETPPGFEPGGKWSVLTCRLEYGGRSARFFLAEKSGAPGKDLPIAWGEGRLWTNSANDAETLLAAFRAAFSTNGEGELDGELEAESEPESRDLLTATTVVLGRGIGRQTDGFSGKGTWTATKWAFEEVDEVFVNWSEAEKRGEFAEKDEAYRAGLQAAIAALARP